MPRYGARANGAWQRPGLRQRAAGLGLAVAVQLLLVVLLLLFGGARVREAIAPTAPTTISFIPGERAPAPSRQAQRSAAEARPRVTQAPSVPRPAPPAPVPLPYLPMSKADLAAADISRFGMASAGAEAGADSAQAVGEGPGGVTLYAAEWVTEPSDAQLGGYLPRSVEAGSWALIACQTIAHNQVENCAQLGESPRGSGLSRAMRLAAWQFRVRPPRINGKPMVGAWVRIRIEFGESAASP